MSHSYNKASATQPNIIPTTINEIAFRISIKTIRNKKIIHCDMNPEVLKERKNLNLSVFTQLFQIFHLRLRFICLAQLSRWFQLVINLKHRLNKAKPLTMTLKSLSRPAPTKMFQNFWGFQLTLMRALVMRVALITN